MQPWQRQMYSPPRRRSVSPQRRPVGSLQDATDARAFGSSTSRDTEAWFRQGHVSATPTGLRPQHETSPVGGFAQVLRPDSKAQCSRCRRYTEVEIGDTDRRTSSRLCSACQLLIATWTDDWTDRRGRTPMRRGQRTPSPPWRGPHSPPRSPRSPSTRRIVSEHVGFGSSTPRTTHNWTPASTGIESTARGLVVSPGVESRRHKPSVEGNTEFRELLVRAFLQNVHTQNPCTLSRNTSRISIAVQLPSCSRCSPLLAEMSSRQH